LVLHHLKSEISFVLYSNNSVFYMSGVTFNFIDELQGKQKINVKISNSDDCYDSLW